MVDLPDVYKSTQRKARKPHTCCECSGIIERGETYHTISALYDGQWYNHKQCEGCFEWFEGCTAEAEHGDGPWFTGLIEWLELERDEIG